MHPNDADSHYLKYTTYCGLYCKLCINQTQIPRQAAALSETLRKAGYEYFGEYCLPGFEVFWDVLQNLSLSEKNCQGCRGDCGDPTCKIRECARKRNLEFCSGCPDYPCAEIHVLADRYTDLIPNGKRQQEIGVEAWLKEQVSLRENGYCYGQEKACEPLSEHD